MCSLHGWIIIITRNRLSFGGFHKWVPQNHWFIMEHPKKYSWFGGNYPYFGNPAYFNIFSYEIGQMSGQGIKLIPN